MLKSTFLWVLVPDIASTPPAVLPSSPPERHRDDSKMCSSLSGPPAAPTPPRSRVLVEGSPHFWDWLIRPPTCGHPSPLAAPAGNHQRGRFKCTIYWSVNEGKQVKTAVHNATERTWASYRKNKWSSCFETGHKENASSAWSTRSKKHEQQTNLELSDPLLYGVNFSAMDKLSQPSKLGLGAPQPCSRVLQIWQQLLPLLQILLVPVFLTERLSLDQLPPFNHTWREMIASDGVNKKMCNIWMRWACKILTWSLGICAVEVGESWNIPVFAQLSLCSFHCIYAPSTLPHQAHLDKRR